MGKEWVKVGEETSVHDALAPLANLKERMNYAQARPEGRPVGSGAVDAPSKSLIAVRFKRSSARWNQPSADRVIQLRAMALSARWGDDIDLTLANLRQEVRAE